ncbi:hypothetical protein A1O3_08940 [Capronia epimyces CBS 606.96]|uniref:Uncharacterized protein n=1 Tax=Capronia epimyces CBS 606.96 TaxID=1182542 RepID=W9XGU7_9EURO|nr:uncharacterized protein A1O3_08940 [Capronia epimyces CBS 606.96]EXJ79438.1 hypothetical protein A1O3_08940 [Capronia epimyces CBS 606.96]
MLLIWATFVTIFGLTKALVLPRDATANVNVSGRNWQSAVQNINGMNSILTLLPVLTGKVQNIKLIASRSFPASLVVAGIGAGRVLSKLQMGILLWSFELYRNTVAELSYPHDEYVNRYMPKLRHVPSGTAERHTTSLIVNHNLAEAYMVEAWFQARGCPSTLRLKQNNYTKLLVGSVIYLAFYSAETFLAVQNGADGTRRLLTVVQAVCVCLWLGAVIMVQVTRGQGKADVQLNRTGSPEYRCLQMPAAGNYVTCEVLSFHLNNLSGFQLYGAKYEQPVLRAAGGMILISGVLDVVSTVLIVGLTAWAYPWIGIEVVIILTKVIFCLEPAREIEIASVSADTGGPNQTGPDLLPLKVELGDSLVCRRVTTDHNIVHDPRASLDWRSTTAGLWIGQAYVAEAGSGNVSTRYLAIDHEQKLTLLAGEPEKQNNQALQREFLAALATVVEANAVPSNMFIAAVERTLDNVKSTMATNWFAFGSKDVVDKIGKARRDQIWRRYL